MKNILITGASRGIGRSLAERYLKQGDRVFAVARNVSDIAELAREAEYSGRLAFAQCDVSSNAAAADCINEAYSKFGHIDIAILNAGISGSESFLNFSADNFRKIFDTNLFGVLNFMEYIVPKMRESGSGTIVGISSLADSRGFAGSAAYSSSKSALSCALEAARAELKSSNINVITVRPGFVRTDMTAKNRFKMPFLMDVDRATEIIINGIESDKKRINFPLPTTLLTTLVKIIPGNLFDLMMGKYRIRIDG